MKVIGKIDGGRIILYLLAVIVAFLLIWVNMLTQDVKRFMSQSESEQIFQITKPESKWVLI